MVNNFPDRVDPLLLFQDVDIVTKPLVDQFYTLYDANDFSGIDTLFQKNPILKNIIINSERIQEVYDSVISLERFYLNDIQQYLVLLVQHKGTYSPTQKYNKYNVVNYQTQNLMETFMCIKEGTPIGTLPTNATYFIAITLAGATFTPSVSTDGIISWSNDKGLPNPPNVDIKGVSGTGLSPREAWSKATVYGIYDLVSYENKLWYALRANTGKIPSANPLDWFLFLQISSAEGSITSTTSTTVDINGVISVDVKADYKPPALKSKPNVQNISTSWVGADVPYTQEFAVSGITANSVIEVSLASSATKEQTKQYDLLNIKDGGQSAGKFALRAWGKKNIENIPINIIIREDVY